MLVLIETFYFFYENMSTFLVSLGASRVGKNEKVIETGKGGFYYFKKLTIFNHMMVAFFIFKQSKS